MDVAHTLGTTQNSGILLSISHAYFSNRPILYIVDKEISFVGNPFCITEFQIFHSLLHRRDFDTFQYSQVWLKSSFSEKATKIWRNLPQDFDIT